jgi:hypothetical protein
VTRESPPTVPRHYRHCRCSSRTMPLGSTHTPTLGPLGSQPSDQATLRAPDCSDAFLGRGHRRAYQGLAEAWLIGHSVHFACHTHHADAGFFRWCSRQPVTANIAPSGIPWEHTGADPDHVYPSYLYPNGRATTQYWLRFRSCFDAPSPPFYRLSVGPRTPRYTLRYFVRISEGCYWLRAASVRNLNLGP